MEDLFDYKDNAISNFKIKKWSKEDCIDFIKKSDRNINLKNILKELNCDLRHRITVEVILNKMSITSLKSMCIEINQDI